MDNYTAYKTLKNNRDKLGATEYKTLKGQITSGDVDGAMKGLRKLIERKQRKV